MGKRIIAAVFALVWGMFAAIGIRLVSRLAQRGVPGFPKSGQWELYVIVPVTMTLLGVILILSAKRLPRALYVGLLIAEIAPIVPFLLIYGGGV